MALWKVSGPDGRNLLVEAPAGNEGAVRELVAGRGDSRDERWLSQDEASVSEHRESGSAKILYELPRDAVSEDGKKAKS